LLYFNHINKANNTISSSPLIELWARIRLRWDALDTTLCDKVCQWLAAGRWFSLGTPVSSTNKTDIHDITELLLKVTLNTIMISLTLIVLQTLPCPFLNIPSALRIIKVITKLPNSEQSYKGKVKTHNYINRQNQSTTGKLWKP
jgi:hypothetical protein